MRYVYIAAPYHAETPEEMERNKQAALAACEEAYKLGRLTGEMIIPITPLVNFPYLNENDPKERGQALKMGFSLMTKCDEVWCAGDHVSEGMKGEIRAAVRMDKPVYSMGMEQERIQAALSGMEPMFTEKHCYKNSDSRDYANQLLVLKASALAPWAKEPENQLWITNGGGFGTSPTASGRAVFAKCLHDGEEARWNRSDFIGVANLSRLPGWVKEKLSEIQEQNNEESEELEE